MPERLRWMCQEGFDANQETSRQFRLPPDRHALAMYDLRYGYSVVLIYRTPRLGAAKAAAMTTADGSLEAWLLRHKRRDVYDRTVPVETWARFLGLSAGQRERQKHAFRLTGALQLRHRAEGVIAQVCEIDLRSTQPLPVDAAYIDREAELAKRDYAVATASPGADKAGAKDRLNIVLAGLLVKCLLPAREPAVIKGSLITGVGRSIFDGLVGS